MSEQEGSLHKVPLTTILALTDHPNAHSLEVATVYGFQVIVRKGQYKVGDEVVYVPVDSLLPQWLENELFPMVKDEKTGAMVPPKVKLNNHRVRQIRLRGLASQGMLIDPNDLVSIIDTNYLSLERDLSEVLGITKYQPPQAGYAQTLGKGKNRNKKRDNPLFHKYNGLENIKWFPNLFEEGELVYVQEKLHGTNARASILPYAPTTLWKRIKKALGLAPKYEKCYGSNNVEISASTFYKGYYGSDIYGDTFKKEQIFDKIEPGEIVYGEIVGPGIQKNYEYGLKEHRFFVFDVKVLQSDGKFRWLNPKEVRAYCRSRGLITVPRISVELFNKEKMYALTKGPSLLDPKTKVREGIVIKAANDYDTGGNKKAVKWVSEDYLDDKTNTDFH